MTFKCIVIDPPWNEQGGGKSKRGADRHYPLMKTPDIVRTVLQARCWQPDDNAHLWLWTTDNYLPDALHVMRAVGFRYVRTMCWIKMAIDQFASVDREGRRIVNHRQRIQIGLGQYLRGSHELCLFGVRGRLKALARDVPSVVIAPRTRHSEKPQQAFDAIERVSPGPRLEMFARQRRPGWATFGDEIETVTSGQLGQQEVER